MSKNEFRILTDIFLGIFASFEHLKEAKMSTKAWKARLTSKSSQIWKFFFSDKSYKVDNHLTMKIEGMQSSNIDLWGINSIIQIYL